MLGLRAFARDERGAVTVEFVTIFTGFVFFILMVTDACVLYLTHTELFNVSRQVAREVSVGALHVDDVPEYVRQRAKLGGRTYTAGSYSGSVVIIELSVDVADASVVGFFEPILDRRMTVRVEMLREPTPEPTSTGGTV